MDRVKSAILLSIVHFSLCTHILVEIANEAQNGGKIKENVNVKAVGNPCPVCGTPIMKGDAFTSTFYICPACQIEK